jgi:dimethylhistidine N-methyltransferase
MALDIVSSTRDAHADFRVELLVGLQADEKTINPKFFYDERGSTLFSQICELPEYYPTRTEIGIFQHWALAIAEAIGPDSILLEPGAGGCEKVRHLLPALAPAVYLPQDISAEFLMTAVASLRNEFPAVRVQPLVADFTSNFGFPEERAPGRKVLFYPGSTIGNFTPEQALEFLSRAAVQLGQGGGLLIGVDLHKSSDILNAAYNDSQGITAAFNLNILQHCNHLLDTDFDVRQFQHEAFYNTAEQRIEMHLVSALDQQVTGDNCSIEFRAGEKLLTEYSYKYSRQDFEQLAMRAGFQPCQYWQDDDGLFGVHYFEVPPAE